MYVERKDAGRTQAKHSKTHLRVRFFCGGLFARSNVQIFVNFNRDGSSHELSRRR